MADIKRSHLKIIDAAARLQETPYKNADIFFQASPFIVAPLPHRKSKALIHKQTRGGLTLSLVANADIGLPYGAISRLILVWLTTEARRQNCRALTFDHISQFAAQIGCARSGGMNGGLTAIREHARRLFTSSLQYQHVCDAESVYLVEGQGFFLIEQYKLWQSRRVEEGAVIPFHPNDLAMQITLSEPFFELIKRHAVPFDLRIMTILRQSTLAMDIYLWLTYTFQSLKKAKCVFWASLKSQFGHNYAENRSGRSVFKKRFTAAMKLIHTVYPSAKLVLTCDGLIIKPSQSSVIKRPVKEKKGC